MYVFKFTIKSTFNSYILFNRSVLISLQKFNGRVYCTITDCNPTVIAFPEIRYLALKLSIVLQQVNVLQMNCYKIKHNPVYEVHACYT